jgi:outer membrane receptor protein involved in Fe transport
MSARPARPRSVPIALPRRTGVAVASSMLGVYSLVAGAAPPYLGQPVDTVLRELAAQGDLHLVYTLEQVPAERVVTREPRATAPLEVIRELLASSGLELRRVDGHTYAIVRAAPAPARRLSAANPLDEVVVTSSRYALAADVPDLHTLLTQDELVALPRLAEDALKAVHRLPGAASNGLAGLAHVRGGAANETLVLLDGLPLYEPFHLRLLQGPTSVLDERILEGLDAYAGGFTAEFGDRMSGIIDARSRHPDADAYYELGLSLMHANALASHSFAEGRGRWLASFRRSNLDEIADTLESDLGELTYVDGFARVDYEWSPSTRGSLHVLLASDEAEINNPAGTEHSDAEYSNTYVWATLSHDWSARFATDALVAYTAVSARREASVDEKDLRSGSVHDDREYDVLGLRLDARYSTDRTVQRAGLDVRLLDAAYDYHGEVEYEPGYPLPGASNFVRALSPEPSGEHVALYYTIRMAVTDALTGEVGLRWDKQTYGPDSDDQFGPRVNFAWRLDERTRLLASWGRHQQFQGIEELQVEDGVAHFQRAQRADHAILGLERELGHDLSLRVEAYRKDYSRLHTRYENLYDPLSLAPELRWDRVAIEPYAARADGLELLLTHRPVGAWSGWASYAWSRVVDRLGGADVRRSWDQTHTMNVGVGWTRGPWQATVAGQYHTGWPVTSIGVDATGDVVLGGRNDSRYAHFGSLDARLSREWPLARGTLTAHLEVTNALDRRNPCCTDLDYDDGMLGRELRHWLPLVPSVGVLWKF